MRPSGDLKNLRTDFLIKVKQEKRKVRKQKKKKRKKVTKKRKEEKNK